MPAKSLDVLGVGANSTDYVYLLPEFPRPDGPSSKLRISRHAALCGGQTATALCTCAAMGLRAGYAGTTGNDGPGEHIRRELARRGIDVEHVRVRNAPSPFAVILIDERHGERVVLWDRSPALRLEPHEIDAAMAVPARLVHVDDTDTDAALHAARRARAAGLPVTSDIERVTDRTGELVEAVTAPIFAEHVLEPLTGERDVERALRAVRRRHDGLLCVTLGAAGAALLDGDELHRAEGYRVAAVDTTGAGDVFRGAFIAALLRGSPPPEILRFANAAAALACTRLGAMEGVPTEGEVMALINRGIDDR